MKLQRLLLTAVKYLPLLVLVVSLSSLVLAHGDNTQPRWEALKDFSGPFEHAWELWYYALTSTVLISAAPFVILFFIPIRNASEHSSFLKVLLSFASGGLLGDAFLHLIPHAVTPHHHHHSDEDHMTSEDHTDDHEHTQGQSHEHAHDHMQEMVVGLWVLGGIITFLVVEKLVRLAKGGGHSHGGPPQPANDDSTEVVKGSQNGSASNVRRRGNKDKTPEASKTSGQLNDAQPKDIKVSAFLNLAADFTHNFTDGLAIGASYLAGRSVGIVTTITILFHEIPHEIGDFAILIQSGFSKRSAMFVQLLTGLGAIAGTVCGLLAEGVGTDSATAWILPFTAGGFIYIATVSVIPEILEDTAVWQSVKEVLAMLVGIGMMVLITYIE